MTATIYESPIALPELFQDTGLDLEDSIDFDEWEQLGLNMQRMERSSKWWLGDWLNFGEEHFGDMSSQAINPDGLEPKTLMNYRRIAERIPRADRLAELSWSHHRIAAEMRLLKDRRRVLRQALKENMTTRELQTLVSSLSMKDDQHDDDDGDTPTQREPVTRSSVTFMFHWTVQVEHSKPAQAFGDPLEEALRSHLAEFGVTPTRVTYTNNAF